MFDQLGNVCLIAFVLRPRKQVEGLFVVTNFGPESDVITISPLMLDLDDRTTSSVDLRGQTNYFLEA